MSSWPAALRLITRRLLDGIDPFPREGILQMININNFSAYLKQADLRNGQIILYDMETQLATCFQSAGEMFDAGWIADLQSNSQFSLLVETGDVTETQALPAASKELSSQTTATEANRVVSFKTCKARERATMKSKIQS